MMPGERSAARLLLDISDELPLGELLRRTQNLLRAQSADDLKDAVHWLQAYK